MLEIAVALLVAQAAASTPPPPAACTDPAFAAFDFWVGEWDVYQNGKDTLVAHSRIEKLYGGCAIRENWTPLKGAGGGSLSNFEPATGRWHQTWIGSAPGRVDFDGGPSDGKMVLTGWWPHSGPKGEDGLTRMTYSRVDGAAVHQFGEFSSDQGLTWQTTFDLVYRRHKSGD